jgi:hypothetical protein
MVVSGPDVVVEVVEDDGVVEDVVVEEAGVEVEDVVDAAVVDVVVSAAAATGIAIPATNGATINDATTICQAGRNHPVRRSTAPRSELRLPTCATSDIVPLAGGDRR